MYNQSRSFSSDGSVAAIRCRTVGGRRTLYVPTKKIIDAANNALKHSGKWVELTTLYSKNLSRSMFN